MTTTTTTAPIQTAPDWLATSGGLLALAAHVANFPVLPARSLLAGVTPGGGLGAGHSSGFALPSPGRPRIAVTYLDGRPVVELLRPWDIPQGYSLLQLDLLPGVFSGAASAARLAAVLRILAAEAEDLERERAEGREPLHYELDPEAAYVPSV